MKNGILFFVLIISLSGQSYVPEEDPDIDIGDWRVSNEPIEFNLDASIMHLAGSAGLARILDDHLLWWQTDAITLPWERVGAIGGEGFSANDVKMDLLGVALNRSINHLVRFVLQKDKKNELSRVSIWVANSEQPKLYLSLNL
jgi:hypothetical protein